MIFYKKEGHINYKKDIQNKTAISMATINY